MGNLTLLGRKGESISYAGSVGRSGIIFLLFGRGSSGGLGLFLLPGGLPLGLGAGCACFIGFLIENIFLKDLRGIRRDPKTARRTTTPAVDDLAFQVCQPEAQVSQGDGAEPVSTIDGAHAALQRYLGQDVVPQIAQHAEVDLAVYHHADELKDLLPARDEAGAKHVVDAEGLGRRCGRRGGVYVHSVWLLLQLQIVQNEAVAVVGNAQAVRGLAVGGSSEVGADPGGQPCARVGAFRKERPIQRAERCVYPVQVAAPVCREEAVGDSDLVDGQPGVALQVQRLSQVYLKVAVRAGYPLAAVHVDRRHSFL